MKSIFDLWIYRVFFGTWLGCIAFPMAYIAFCSGSIPAIPNSVVILTVAMMGGDALGTYLKDKTV